MPQITRTWSIPTSPRNPYKLVNELRLLSEFEGQKWNKSTQKEFAKRLEKSDLFEGTVSATEPDFSARDRINRAPKTFGFVRFDKDKEINITEAGKQLIAGCRLDELFLRQLLKWQYPSANHDKLAYKENFCIKPFLEVLRIMRELAGVTKYELAIFCIPLVDYKNTKSTIKEIKDFRAVLMTKKTSIDRKKFIKEAFYKKSKKIYQEDLKNENIHVREGLRDGTADAFIQTKIRNAKDYADAAMRYFRATGLFAFSGRNYRLDIINTKWEIAEEILAKTDPNPITYSKSPKDFLDYLCSASLPTIPQDDVYSIISEIEAVSERYIINNFKLKSDEREKIQNLRHLDIEELKNLRDILNNKLCKLTTEKEQEGLKNYDSLDDIIDIFEKIEDRYNDEIPDKPLFLEWNVWRALSLLNDGEIIGNFKMDLNGMPLSTASGNRPDIECYYKDFVLIVEVTLSTGQRQYETEGEPVPRHIGQVVRTLREKGDKRPVYGLFIASSLNNSAVAHFFVSSRVPVEYYGGKVKVTPLNTEAFIEMLKHAKDCGGIKANDISKFLEWTDPESNKFINEQAWGETVINNTKNWTKIANT